jgi:Major Facilitator Superfamily
MSGPPGGLATRVVGYFAARDLIPLFAVYALLFRDHGLTTAQISTLFVIWSVTSFALEVPCGALADVVSRRDLLTASGLLYAAGFALWTWLPSYAGFAAGFVLWGASSALQSGTFEALVYDELAAAGQASSYPRLIGWASSAAMVCNLIATLSAAPLFALGGYRLVGAVSVGCALLQVLLARCLPAAPRTLPATGLVGPIGSLPRSYLDTLWSGLDEVRQRQTVRRAVVFASLLVGLLALDEYFPLLAREKGASTSVIPVVIGVIVACQALGTALAGRTAWMTGRAMAGALSMSAALVMAGALAPTLGGLLLVGVGYGVANNAIIVAEARLQHVIQGAARATVLSVSGLSSEVFALCVYGAFAVGSHWAGIAALVTGLAAVQGGLAALAPRWLPARRRTTGREPPMDDPEVRRDDGPLHGILVPPHDNT